MTASPSAASALPPVQPAGVPSGSGNDAALAARLATGDRDALDELIVTHRDRVVRLAHRLLGWPDDVDDVVQDVFVAAMTRARTFRGDATIATWLTRITINACRRVHRRRAIARVLALTRSAPAVAVDEHGADERLERRQDRTRLRAAVAELPARHREVIVLRYLEQWPVARIAALLGVAVNTVEARLSRARRRLRDRLAKGTF